MHCLFHVAGLVVQDAAKQSQALDDTRAACAKLKAANDAANKALAQAQEAAERDKATIAASRAQIGTLEATVSIESWGYRSRLLCAYRLYR